MEQDKWKRDTDLEGMHDTGLERKRDISGAEGDTVSESGLGSYHIKGLFPQSVNVSVSISESVSVKIH